eukprot:3152971-Pyramimonas_sp.AAC.1
MSQVTSLASNTLYVCDGQALHKRKVPYMEFRGRARHHPDPDLPFGNPGVKTQPYAILRDAPRNLKENQKSSVNKLSDVYQVMQTNGDGV